VNVATLVEVVEKGRISKLLRSLNQEYDPIWLQILEEYNCLHGYKYF